MVTTPVGATTGAITDGVTGMLVPPGDVEALAAVLARIIQDEELRGALQQGARRRFLEMFDIAAYCARLEELYRDTIASAQRRTSQEE